MSNGDTQPLLACRNVFKYFGGLAAVNDFNLDVYPGDVVGIGGPNGAGKTTFLDVISGINPATSGSILLGSVPIANKKPDAICHLGISRTFQLNAGFESMSIRENTLVGALLEDAGVIDNLDEILAVEGIDYFSIGPNDFAQGLGKPGEGFAPEVQQVIAEVYDRIRAAGRAVGDDISRRIDVKNSLLTLGSEFLAG